MSRRFVVRPEVTVLDVSDHQPRRVPSKTWRSSSGRSGKWTLSAVPDAATK